MSSRRCPLCTTRLIPVYRAMCRRCFDKVPWLMRARLLKAWQRRILDPVDYQEKLAGVQQWFIDFRAERKEAFSDNH